MSYELREAILCKSCLFISLKILLFPLRFLFFHHRRIDVLWVPSHVRPWRVLHHWAPTRRAPCVSTNADVSCCESQRVLCSSCYARCWNSWCNDGRIEQVLWQYVNLFFFVSCNLDFLFLSFIFWNLSNDFSFLTIHSWPFSPKLCAE